MTKNFKLNDKDFFYNTVNFIFTLCFARFALSLQKFLINKSSNYDK